MTQTASNLVVLVGRGPLPGSNSRYLSGQGLRTAQFRAALAGAKVRYVTLLAAHPGAPRESGPEEEAGTTQWLEADEVADPKALRARLDALKPTALVGAGTYPSYLLARSGHPAPQWIDLNGDPMAEAQALAARTGDDAVIERHWWMLGWCLRRGDRFSAVSARQRFALIGQLGAMGRLVGRAASYEWVHVVPVSCPPDEPEVPEVTDSPRLLFSGSFNAWCDDATLLQALALACRREMALELHLTGAPILGMEHSPWERLRSEVQNLGLATRVHIHGQLTEKELAALEESCVAAIVPELAILEREIGGQNRSVRCMARGLPVVTTDQCEMCGELAARGLVLTYRPGDREGLAERLVGIAREPRRAREVGRRARAWVRERYSVVATTESLRAWVSEPAPAPDRGNARRSALARRLSEITISQMAGEPTDEV